MKKINYSVIFLFFIVFSAQSIAARPTIAVLDFNITKEQVSFGNGFVVVKNFEDTTKLLSSDLLTYLVKTNKFNVVERDRMADLLKEQDFSESGYLSPESAVKMGKLIGADYFVMGKIEQVKAKLERKKIPYTSRVQPQYEGKMVVNVRIVDSRGGKIVSADKFTVEHEDRNRKNEVTPDDFLISLQDKTVQRIVNGIVGGVFPLKIIKIAGGEVYLNRGDGAEFQVGSTLSVLVQGESLIDPDTGESLGSTEKEVGTVQVSEIQQKFSKANIITGAKRIKKGAIVRLSEADPDSKLQSRELTPGSSDKPVNW
ncbi:MAG: hypothetical protein GXP08_06135 [Gammaproteobacteria bacterium]|nr:hypothetical protein [Gammaproteobacteria bacterium]